jgi:5-methylcytosine-specific restriction endonuclease McrA
MDKRKTRSCVNCGRTFYSASRTCQTCRDTDRTCGDCGRTFKGHTRLCSTCQGTVRACASCGKQFKGTNRLCTPCQAVERTCEGCGRIFKGHTRLCPVCIAPERTCESCGRTFKSTNVRCNTCRWVSLPLEVRKAQAASRSSARRELILAAEGAGSVPPQVYAAIRASGPCAYCGQPARTVDHVWPLSRGGPEREDNLVPACMFCNVSKGNRLLTEWYRADLVAHGVDHSVRVAAEYARLTSEAA